MLSVLFLLYPSFDQGACPRVIIIGTDDGDQVVGANDGSSIHVLPVIVSSEQKLWYQSQEVVLLVVHARGPGHEFTSSCRTAQ